ncbi:MAG: 2,3-bisphosphoglycerate-independent phosphoglycerate mutase [Campylobacterales bacterium]
MGQKTVLVITDGIGYSQRTEANAFYHAKKPTYDKLFAEVPHALIDTFGLSVGLPEGQMGNSEVGHMTIGSGRVLYQDLVKISLAVAEGTLASNPVLTALLESSDTLHLIGLMSDGGVHSHIDHTIALAKIAEAAGKQVWLHLITDGRDVSPTSAPHYLQKLQEILNDNVRIATIGGRFYTMDRDHRWERIKAGYDAIVTAAPAAGMDPAAYIEASYAKEETDEFIVPAAFEGYEGMKAGDAVLVTNFRSDRVREITTALASADFSEFERPFAVADLATMTEYEKSFPYPVLFRKETPKNTLAEVISKQGLRQFHTAETEKYAHVTFFLNGGIDEPYENETRVLVPSPKVKTYDEQPQMSAPAVGDAVVKAMDEGYAFVVVNFATGDMVGHTGKYEAAVQAVEAVDHELGRIVEKAKENDYAMVLTSDHGNCEEMWDEDGNVLTNHTVGKVWAFVMAEGVEKVHPGGLNNIAPTVLKLMGVEAPAEMDDSLL